MAQFCESFLPEDDASLSLLALSSPHPINTIVTKLSTTNTNKYSLLLYDLFQTAELSLSQKDLRGLSLYLLKVVKDWVAQSEHDKALLYEEVMSLLIQEELRE